LFNLNYLSSRSEISCLVCGSQNFSLLYQDTLRKCSNCEFISANLSINHETLAKIYTENYFLGEEYLDYVSDKDSIQKNFQTRIRDSELLLEKESQIKALEIGCAYGFFGEIFKNRYPKATYEGIDIVPEAISYGREAFGLNLVCDDYLQRSYLGSSFTDVFLLYVIEHLGQPQKYISKIHRELVTGGRLYITTGDIEALVAKFRKEKWRMIHPPSHLHYFSKKTLGLFLSGHGFKVIHISYPAYYRSLKFIFYSLFLIRKKRNGILNKIFEFVPKSMYIPINTFDIMFVIAEKQ